MRKALKNADDDFLASCIAISLTKLAIKSKKNLQMKRFNKISVDSSLIICALLKAHGKTVDINNVQRMQLCLKILTNPKLLKSTNGIQKILADQSKKIYQKFLESNSRLIKSNDPNKDDNQLLIT